MIEFNEEFMKRAVNLSREGMTHDKGGPFGAVVVKDGEIVAEGYNLVTSTNDPTAHGEIVAIRRACEKLQTFQLDGCAIYTSCEPCPMCLGAIYWARPAIVYYANSRKDAAVIDFDDSLIYDELVIAPTERSIPFIKVSNEEAITVFNEWHDKTNRTLY
ncbi:MAG TPA: nucleoside deaminase [Candidatus Saccharimonadales bacterium]